jgi:hypothetical protein
MLIQKIQLKNLPAGVSLSNLLKAVEEQKGKKSGIFISVTDIGNYAKENQEELSKENNVTIFFFLIGDTPFLYVMQSPGNGLIEGHVYDIDPNKIPFFPGVLRLAEYTKVEEEHVYWVDMFKSV